MKIEWDSIYEFVVTPPGPVANWALKELAEKLQRLKVDVDVRLLGVPDAFPDGGWCIHQEDEVWLVYHSERGRRSGVADTTLKGAVTGSRSCVGPVHLTTEV